MATPHQPPSVAEPLTRAILDLLCRLPLHWKAIDYETLTGTEQKALKLMGRRGLVEERLSVRASMKGFPVETSGVVEVRLTDQGELARHDYETQTPEKPSAVSAFVCKAGFFALRPPVQGAVVLESCRVEKDKTDSPAGLGNKGPAAAPAPLSLAGDADHVPDFTLPRFQNEPSCAAILDFLRRLTPHFLPVSRELTDAEWTAFRALAKKGAAEGILRIVCTPEHATEAVTEYHHIQGDYVNAMIPGFIRRDRPIDERLVQARLTAMGQRLAGVLQREKTEDAAEVRAAVLEMLWRKPIKLGSDQMIPLPDAATLTAAGVAQERVDSQAPAEQRPTGADGKTAVPQEGAKPAEDGEQSGTAPPPPPVAGHKGEKATPRIMGPEYRPDPNEDWYGPMTMAEIARRLDLDSRTAQEELAKTGLWRVGRQKWKVRLDTLPPTPRKKVQTRPRKTAE